MIYLVCTQHPRGRLGCNPHLKSRYVGTDLTNGEHLVFEVVDKVAVLAHLQQQKRWCCGETRDTAVNMCNPTQHGSMTPKSAVVVLHRVPV